MTRDEVLARLRADQELRVEDGELGAAVDLVDRLGFAWGRTDQLTPGHLDRIKRVLLSSYVAFGFLDKHTTPPAPRLRVVHRRPQ